MSEKENQIVVYRPNETVRLDVRLENEMVWLNRHQIAQLFGRVLRRMVYAPGALYPTFDELLQQHQESLVA
jgi:hypothetical protein